MRSFDNQNIGCAPSRFSFARPNKVKNKKIKNKNSVKRGVSCDAAADVVCALFRVRGARIAPGQLSAPRLSLISRLITRAARTKLKIHFSPLIFTAAGRGLRPLRINKRAPDDYISPSFSRFLISFQSVMSSGLFTISNSPGASCAARHPPTPPRAACRHKNFPWKTRENGLPFDSVR